MSKRSQDQYKRCDVSRIEKKKKQKQKQKQKHQSLTTSLNVHSPPIKNLRY